MGVAKLFYPHAVILPGSPGATITELQELRLPRNYTENTEFSAGDFAPGWVSVQDSTPRTSIRTRQIKSWLAALAASGGIYLDAAGGNLDVHWRAGKNRGSRFAPSDSAHVRARMAENAIAVTHSIAAEGGPAELTGEITPVSISGASPVTWSALGALAGTSAVPEMFRNGPISINGTQIPTQGFTLALNVQMDDVMADGEGYLSWSSVMRISPVLTATSTNVELMNTFGPNGTPLTSLLGFLKAMKPNNKNYADNEEEHIQFAASSGIVQCNEVSGSRSEVQLSVRMSRPDATTLPIAFTLDQAISFA